MCCGCSALTALDPHNIFDTTFTIFFAGVADGGCLPANPSTSEQQFAGVRVEDGNSSAIRQWPPAVPSAHAGVFTDQA